MLFQDTLHACDLGIANHVVANTLVYMVESRMVGGPRDTKEENMTMIWKEVQGDYREHGINNQVGNLGMSMVNANHMSEYLELTSHLKGAQTEIVGSCSVLGLRQPCQGRRSQGGRHRNGP